ncbi:conserved hypothetical protein (plasmid) [Candidatus Protochlamydia naegleriophila]|uniref:Uncharacterized protein n=1 Tax=Candidatus Protochlamydia naegleriophila TaxID=389348 RepID=A0A0U5JJU5_9BACT|nr:hypothetical protein [Candidatus Protochlamydia naegleriophila]CUI18070.1 conserved hypothetical protein [Candidatus Protochlamydia naegleriophila]
MTRANIEINKIGKILKGDNENYYILIKEDFENTGGYLIYVSEDLNFKSGNGFDYWVEKLENLVGFFEESKWEIKWNIK